MKKDMIIQQNNCTKVLYIGLMQKYIILRFIRRNDTINIADDSKIFDNYNNMLFIHLQKKNYNNLRIGNSHNL